MPLALEMPVEGLHLWIVFGASQRIREPRLGICSITRGRGCQPSMLYGDERRHSPRSARSSVALACIVSSVNGDGGFRTEDTRHERFSRVC
jgi:hypothetical protein